MISPLPGVTDGQARLGADRRCRASAPRWSTTRRTRCPTAAAATSCSPSRGRRCCAASGATRSATRRPTGRGSTDMYFAGDGAKKDEDGDIWLLGRVDDVMNVSGPPALHDRDRVRAGVAPEGGRGGRRRRDRRDDRAGASSRSSSCAARRRRRPPPARRSSQELRNHVAKEIGPIAKPRQIMVVPELPKTRSGKIMRRLLRDVAENREVGDVHDAGRLGGDGPDQDRHGQAGGERRTERPRRVEHVRDSSPSPRELVLAIVDFLTDPSSRSRCARSEGAGTIRRWAGSQGRGVTGSAYPAGRSRSGLAPAPDERRRRRC